MSLKTYSEYKESGVDWLDEYPSGWQVSRLSRLLLGIKDGTHGTFERVDDGRHFLSAKNIQDWGIKIGESESQISEDDFRSIVSNGYPAFGDVALTIVGTIGRSCVYRMHEPMAFQRSVCFLRSTPDLDADFLNFQIQSDVFQEQLRLKTKVSAQPGVYMGDVASIGIVLPPYDDQIAIANYLDREVAEIDAFIADQEVLIALLGERRIATITRAVTKGIDPEAPMKDSGLEWLGDVPAGWSVQRLSHVTSAVIDCLHSTPEKSDEGKFISIRTGCIRNGRLLPEKGLTIDELTFRERTAKGTPEAGDVFFTREAPAGEAALVDDLGQYALGQRMVLLKPSSELLDSRFLVWNIYMPHVRRYIDVEANGSTVKNLPIPDIKSIPIVVPRKDQQQRIIEYLNQEITEIDAAITDAGEAIALSTERRVAVISAAVTGKIDVRRSRT